MTTPTSPPTNHPARRSHPLPGRVPGSQPPAPSAQGASGAGGTHPGAVRAGGTPAGRGGWAAGSAGWDGLEPSDVQRWWELALVGLAWVAAGVGLAVAVQVAGWLLP
jgi:hypothetical protein